MKEPSFLVMASMVFYSGLMLVAGLYLLANYNRLFRRWIRREWLRQNLVVWMIGICLIFSVTPTNPEFYVNLSLNKLHIYFLVQAVASTVLVFCVFNVCWLVLRTRFARSLPFKQRMILIFCTLVITAVIIIIPINYVGNHYSFKNLHIAVLYMFYLSSITGLIYITMNYVKLEKEKKLNEQDLELSRLRELKTKAELDALHSKINPHFLYNALNSIADLSITDGKKGRRMTVALADLFRYSINYSNNNFSRIREEVEMADVYLQIEKIRFEDQLNYSMQVEPGLEHYLVPRFVLQPLVENAVKHGLKATGKMTEIKVEVKQAGEGLVINVADNGPAFPAEMTPGYGVKSVYDKLDLLFSGHYEIHFSNEPVKQVSLYLNKLVKDESAVPGYRGG